MTTRIPSFLRAFLVAALAWVCAGPLLAQHELKNPALNPLFKASSGVDGTPVDPDGTPVISTANPQFRGVGITAATAGPVSTSATITARYPASPAGSGASVVLQRANLGNPFASGVPRYLLGDVVTPPSTQVDGITPAGPLYWRAQPVVAGETFVQPTGAQDGAPVAAGTVASVYHSPHAKRVFAHQAGRVAVTWVTREAVAFAADPVVANRGLRYRYRPEVFSVSSATTKPVRTIYWTERSFNGPYVNIPNGSIETVNPVYSALFPATVAGEYQPVGVSQNTNPNGAPVPELRTFWFEKVSGIGQLHAYNVEGRVFVEYLGTLEQGSTSVHEFIGADIVEVVRVAPSNNVTVKLGERITPRDDQNRLLPLDQSAEWLASPILNAVANAEPAYSSHARADGQLVYYAERENENPDRVVFYWLQQSDAAIHFYPAPTSPDLGIYWPILRNHYVQEWPSGVADYAHYTVAASGSTTATGIQFPDGSLPRLVYQDDGAQQEAALDFNTQRLTVSASVDGFNRALLKFTSGNEVWYVRLYTQAEGRPGFLEGDSALSLSAAAVVGDRIEAPNGYLKSGYIASGTGYLPAAYRDPFAVGAVAAEQGAIIPVNAVPGNNQLTIWWFKRVEPPSAVFSPFYVPAKVGRYTVAYPASPSKIVLASNAGSGDLSGAQIAGSLYVQNDRALPGFNPNEEHALMLGGRIYALRDDLNNTSATASAYTSQPFALLSYTSPVDDRPAMRAFQIVREVDLAGTANDIRFDYPATAGTILQGPMPLPLLPLPVTASGTVANTEIFDIPDTTAHQGPALYDKFTFKDRKGYDWVYRGPHGGATAAVTSPLPNAHFNVAGDRGIWTGSNDIGSISVADGLYSGVATGAGDAGVIAPALNFPGSSVTTVVVRMRASANVTAELRWSNSTSGGHGLSAAYTGNGDWQTLSFPVSTSSAWTGKTITYLQLDPAVTAGVTFAIDWIGVPTASLGMQFYYTMREDFHIPGLATQPAVGTVLPYLRPLVAGAPVGDAVTGAPLTITYRPVWPAQAPELRVAETLTLSKFGLPDVFNQASARVLYQQSVAVGGSAKASVILHDPIREKTFALGGAGRLASHPTTLRTSVYSGKTYFQGLPPHLQKRFFYDPLRGTRGALVLTGVFVDSVAGEDYLDLNTLTVADHDRLVALVNSSDNLASAWAGAIASLSTSVQTFVEDPLKAGAFKIGSSVDRGLTDLPSVTDSDTAVVDYALTATGDGDGWVTMLFGDGRAFTPAGDPVAVKVFKVAPRLYTGDLKVSLSANPLDEQVTLRHSGDFAARPDRYEFEWRYAIPQDGSAPPTYSYALTERGTSAWKLAIAPDGFLPSSDSHYAEAVTLPRSLAVNSNGIPADSYLPGSALLADSPVEFTTIPAEIVFSADLGDYTGFVLYVNGVAAVAYNAPATFAPSAAATGLAPGALGRQFSVDRNYFHSGQNTLAVALYSTADAGTSTNVNFKLHASTETELVTASGSPWQTPAGTLQNEIVVGGSPTAPLGSPLLVMADNYFTLRYRPKASANSVAGVEWSRWMQPVLVEGWIKRVLAAINPFNQRMTDLANNAVNTDVSLLTSAGKRWEGDIALTLENINDVGLIEIYETVLNRGKNISIDAGYDAPAVNDALLLAAGYLNDLYTILGNEAYADAANPTISIDDATTGNTSGGGTTVTEVNTSRFSFESQVSSVLDEELALLRGRDDFASPGVSVAPAYNRLYWNYTRGINSGEALYAVNYNIREKAGSSTADGVLNAADAQRMFPQGHGDAYGHYLTALTGYYRLLQNPHFTWTPRSEAVTVLGQAVQIDYFDERKFAGAAANLARTAQQVLSLTHRQVYADDPAAGWTRFRDGKANSSTGVTRRWSLDEWAARATQGAYFNWIVGNALLPEDDIDPTHTGVEVVDRTTVPELAELVATATSFQTTMDNANARLNPLGLSPGAIAFDISPAELQAGKTHYEQIHERALRAVLNAKGSFDQAAKMTRLLRNQENQLDDYNSAIVDQERAFVTRLLDLYGSPYAGDIGAGKTYAQGYVGPDLVNWFIIDRPTDLVDTVKPVTISAYVPIEFPAFTGNSVDQIQNTYSYTAKRSTRSFTVLPNRFVQYADLWPAGGAALGQRGQVGTIQQSLLDVHQAHLALLAGDAALRDRQALFLRRHEVYLDQLNTHLTSVAKESQAFDEIRRLRIAQTSLRAAGALLQAAGESQARTDIHEGLPKVNGFSNDLTAPVRGFLVTTNSILGYIAIGAGVVATNAGDALTTFQTDRQRTLDNDLIALGASHELMQSAYEYEVQYRELTRGYYEYANLATNLQRTSERVRSLLAEGDRILADREIFRLRAAALIQGYRTKDLTFRTFRNEALEQYRSLFDLASRYTYLSAKSYDYETGLLGTTAGDAVISGIVSARSLGDLTGGVPQATVSTLGDSGLAGTMARLQSDWSVAKGRLGINNPDPYGTAFSLRRELFRLRDDDVSTTEDTAWRQTLEQHIVGNVLSDPDVAEACRNLKKPDGSAVPGIVIPFRTTIEPGLNFFGLPLAAGDHAYSVTSYATKIHSAGLVLRGYIGMNPYAIGTPGAGTVNSTDPHALGATPYVYLIPTGTDYMLAPPLGDTGAVRAWNVKDQALPLPFNLGATSFNTTQFFNANGTLSEQPWILRKHQAFRAVDDPAFFYNLHSAEFTNTRLVGRSVWNGGWKIVIPANTLLANEQDGLNRFVASVKDIELFLRTYSHSGN